MPHPKEPRESVGSGRRRRSLNVPNLAPAPQIQEQSVAAEITSTIDKEDVFFFERAGGSTDGHAHCPARIQCLFSC